MSSPLHPPFLKLTSLGGPLTFLWFLLHAAIRVIHRDGSVLQTCCAMQFAVVRVQQTVRPADQLLTLPAASLTDTLRHPAADLALAPLATVLHQARVCGHSSSSDKDMTDHTLPQEHSTGCVGNAEHAHGPTDTTAIQ